MYSFYGGRPGSPFIIVMTYPSIQEMVNNFKLGPNYTTVHYDEYVMINTENKNDPDNGKIYRRGYNFTDEDTGGAEYIGTIVGPSGNAPMLEMTTVADAKNKHASEGYEEKLTTGQYSLKNGNLVPGKTDAGTFNDAINWACCSIRNENNEDSIAYIGFTFPYPVIEFEASGVEPYNTYGRYSDNSFISRVDDKSHPYFEKWRINIPKGIKGDTITNLRIVKATSEIQSYPGQSTDIENGQYVLVYDYYNYDNYKDGNKKIKYLGKYDPVNDFSVSSDGTATVSYLSGKSTTLSERFKWIVKGYINTASDSEEEGTGDQKLHLVYNDGTEEIAEGEPINYVMSMAINDSNHLLVRYSDPVKRASGVIYNGVAGWQDLGQFIQAYEYNDGNSINSLKWCGIGQIIDYGEGKKIIQFTISPTASINPDINQIIINSGQLKAINSSVSITNFNITSNNTSIQRQLTGFHFSVTTQEDSSGAAATDFINISINDMELEFNHIESEQEGTDEDGD